MKHQVALLPKMLMTVMVDCIVVAAADANGEQDIADESVKKYWQQIFPLHSLGLEAAVPRDLIFMPCQTQDTNYTMPCQRQETNYTMYLTELMRFVRKL